jgi:hypothetical protein
VREHPLFVGEFPFEFFSPFSLRKRGLVDKWCVIVAKIIATFPITFFEQHIPFKREGKEREEKDGRR